MYTGRLLLYSETSLMYTERSFEYEYMERSSTIWQQEHSSPENHDVHGEVIGVHTKHTQRLFVYTQKTQRGHLFVYTDTSLIHTKRSFRYTKG